MQKAMAASHHLAATAAAKPPPATMRTKYKSQPPERLATMRPLCLLSSWPSSEGSGGACACSFDATGTSGSRVHRPHPYEFAAFQAARPKAGRLQHERDRGYRYVKHSVEPAARCGPDELQRHLDRIFLVEHLCLVRIQLGPLRKVGNFFTQVAKNVDIDA